MTYRPPKPLKDIKLNHDGYTFIINPLNFYKGNKHDGCQIIGWYKDRIGVLQGIYRDSVYGQSIERQLPKEMPKDDLVIEQGSRQKYITYRG